MTLTIETGAGVRSANAYIDAAFVDSYLKTRQRSADNGWQDLGKAQKESFVVDGTDYIEQRWGPLFRGVREFHFADMHSTASLAFSGVPVAAETVIVGNTTYTHVAVLSDEPYEVLIGIDAAGCASNLTDAILATADQAGVTFSEGTLLNTDAFAVLDVATVGLTATADGSSGDYTVLTSVLTNMVAAAFTGGIDGGEQPLAFPRLSLYTRSGALVAGIPLKLKQASAEYTVRSAEGPLFVDPQTDPLGGNILRLREKVGPIETDTSYQSGTAGSGKPIAYPAADRLLQEYVRTPGAVIRG